MRIFGSERMDAMLRRLGLKEDEAIVHPWINKALEKAQQKVEARNFDIRKNILKFDNVMNDQRKVIFEDRRKMMAQEIAGADHRRDARRRDRRHRHQAHSRRRLSRSLGHRGAQGGGVGEAQPRPAGRRLGQGRGHRRRGDGRAPAQGDRRGLCRARRAQFARGDALCREAGDPADARPPVARPSRHARPFAAGDRLARHGAARSAERVQVRGVRPVSRPDRAMARGGDLADDADRGALPGAAGAPRRRRSCSISTPSAT